MTSIAVLDSDARVVATLARRLGRMYHVVTATDAAGALDAIERGAVDVLLTDILGAGIDGFALVLEARCRRPNLPIVVVSARGSSREPGSGRVVYRYTVPGSRWASAEERDRLLEHLTDPPGEQDESLPEGQVAGLAAGAAGLCR